MPLWRKIHIVNPTFNAAFCETPKTVEAKIVAESYPKLFELIDGFNEDYFCKRCHDKYADWKLKDRTAEARRRRHNTSKKEITANV